MSTKIIIQKNKSLNNLDNDFLLGIINDYLPEKQKISSEKGRILIPEAKKLFLSMENQKHVNEEFDLGIDFFKEAKKDLKRSKHSYKNILHCSGVALTADE